MLFFELHVFNEDDIRGGETVTLEIQGEKPNRFVEYVTECVAEDADEYREDIIRCDERSDGGGVCIFSNPSRGLILVPVTVFHGYDW